ncbi:MAG: hypothetical protein OXG65_06715 [Chloroflexi bacterium]|nr:hypothetical protein [Chloroflexota bacterium]
MELAVQLTGKTRTVPHSRGGVQRLRRQLQALGLARIVLESNGGCEPAIPVVLAGCRARLHETTITRKSRT